MTRLPAPLQSLREQARQQLQTLLRELFERADDALFDLADKAGSNQEQNLYFDSMREVRIRRRGIEAAFFKTLDTGFSALLDPVRQSDQQENAVRVSMDELSLVKNDELEEMVAIDTMINKAVEGFSDQLQPLTLRMDQLVPVKTYQKNNPVAPFTLCHAFADALRPVQVDVKARLLLFKLFDQMVAGRLGEMYKRLNQLLIDANILPSLPVAARKSGYVSGQPSGSASAGERVPSATSGEVGQGAAVAGDQANEILQTLRALLGSRQSSAPAPVTGQQEVLDTADVLQMLSGIQHQPQAGSAVTALPDVRQWISRLSAEQGRKGISINQVDEDVINLVGMMFEFILEDRNLAAPMKALIGRLQIPMVKVAIADKSFFSKGGHPARRLLNEMATAALGWQEDTSGRVTDNLYSRMESMVETILAEFEQDLDIFARLLTDFRAWLDKERRRAQILEQRTLDAEDGKAKAEQAREEVNKVLSGIVGKRRLPEAGLAILHNAWANVMFITALKQGTDSEQWRAVQKTAEVLVWSLSASMTVENRRQLLRTVPPLLQELRQGFESIAFNPFEATRLFKQLEALHLARLKPAREPETSQPEKAEAAAVVTAAPEAEASVLAAPQEAPKVAVTATEAETTLPEAAAEAPLEQATAPETATAAIPADASVVEATAAQTDEAISEVAAESEQQVAITSPAEAAPAEPVLAEDDPHYRLVNNLTQGSWFEMTEEGGQKFRCRLAAIIKATGKYIFVNRSGMKVAEETRQSLALALKNGRLLLLDDGMLFDRALEAVIGSLREQRGEA